MFQRIALLFSLVCLLPFTAAYAGDDGIDYTAVLEQFRLPAPRVMPDIPINDAEGKPHSLKEFRGKVVVLNFWATWCPPCVHEMGSLDALQASMKEAVKLGDIERQPVEVLTVSIDYKGIDTVKGFFEQKELKNLDIYTDFRNNAFRQLGISSLPTTIILNPRGKEVARIKGAIDWSNPEVKKFLMGFAEVSFKE